MNYKEIGESTHQFSSNFVENRHVPRYELLALISATRVQNKVNETKEEDRFRICINWTRTIEECKWTKHN
jgi:hypothetical protein